MHDAGPSMWPLIQEFLKKEGIARHHINSFNRFMKEELQEIITDAGTIQFTLQNQKYTIKFGDANIQKPRIVERDGTVKFVAPSEARLRDTTYAAPIMVQITLSKEDKILRVQHVHIGDIPIMLRSNQCMLHGMSDDAMIQNKEDPIDHGGYFIINGSERVVMVVWTPLE